ncbi:U-box domain-containing protein 16 [Lycium ferocissimum]|uniref:U-box domain-containing protein 16 n=1 Tax=Lycium ferocissimum TaxID=112874 RepID=UPI002814A3E7|nr:U-box domain-containing protein 16 [Lycium ferocissimum]
MAVSPESFPPRKRRPSASSFVSPNLSDRNLLHSLYLLSSEISTLQPLLFLLKRNTSSIIRKSKLLSILFEEIHPIQYFPPSAILCFDELYIVLQRMKTLLEDCRNCSKMWLLMQVDVYSNIFHELTLELSTLLDILPAKKLRLNDDVQELLILVTKQCSEKFAYLDPKDRHLRSQVVEMLDRIEKEIVPDTCKLADIFDKLTLRDSTSCRDEIELLEEEIQSQTDEKAKSDIIALIGFVRYAKCVLYGGSTPRTNSRRRRAAAAAADISVPADFRCPISLDIMRDPAVVSTGQTYDRSSITLWFESGHTTCPKTGQTLAHTDLIPNSALKNLIAMWCREQKIPFESTELNVKSNGVVTNKTALEATRMTVSFLINKLKASQSVDSANRLVHELRVLAKTDSDSRACIAEASALPLLVKLLGSEQPSLQVNAVTTILNLSILEANKTRIMETDGVLNGVIEVLRSGATWEAKGNAAATIFSLSGIPAYKKRLARKTRVVKGLMDLAREGPTNSKRDALVAILNLAGDREAVGKLIEGGVVEMVEEIMDGLPEEAVTILEVVVKKGGLVAVAAAYPLMKKLAIVLRDGTDRARESCAATLVNMCRKGGSEMVAELATVQGIERVIWEIMGMGTGRARRKAATLLRVLRRWAAGLDAEVASGAYSDVNMNTATRIALPG